MLKQKHSSVSFWKNTHPGTIENTLDSQCVGQTSPRNIEKQHWFYCGLKKTHPETIENKTMDLLSRFNETPRNIEKKTCV